RNPSRSHPMGRPAITIAGPAYSALAKHRTALPVLLLGDLAARVALAEDLLGGGSAAVPAAVVLVVPPAPPPEQAEEQHDHDEPQQREEREPPVPLVSEHRSDHVDLLPVSSPPCWPPGPPEPSPTGR